MNLPGFKTKEIVDEHEQLFVGYLGKVLSWARQITGDQSQADDLAQDAYLHFTVNRPDLSSIRNMDHYLYVVIRNLYRSQRSTFGAHREDCLDDVDRHSPQLAAHLDLLETFITRDQLRRLCAFICKRKQKSRSASAFLLRFFRDLDHLEIAAIMNVARGAVDERLRVMRKEVRKFLELPRLLKDDPPADLASIISSSRRGSCLCANDIDALYQSNTAVNTIALAHIVSCDRCLLAVKTFLSGPKRGQNASISRPGDHASTLIEQWQVKRRRLLSADVQKIVLTVNGQVLAVEDGLPANGQFRVFVPGNEPIEFIDLWNGFGLRLLHLSSTADGIETRRQNARQSVHLKLDSGRILSVNLDFSGDRPQILVESVLNRAIVPSPRPFLLKSVHPRPASIWDRFRFAWSPALAMLLVFSLLFTESRQNKLSAATALDALDRWQQQAATSNSPVLHQRFSLVVSAAAGQPLRTKVDVWTDRVSKTRLARRLDASGRVIAESRHPISAMPSVSAASLWEFTPSKRNYLLLEGDLTNAQATQNNNELTVAGSRVSLTLNASTGQSLHQVVTYNGNRYTFEDTLAEAVLPSKQPLALQAKPATSNLANMATRSDQESPTDVREIALRQKLHELDLSTSIQRRGQRFAIRVPPHLNAFTSGELTALGPWLQLDQTDVSKALKTAKLVVAKQQSTPSEPLREPLLQQELIARFHTQDNARQQAETRLNLTAKLVRGAAELHDLAVAFPAARVRRLSAPVRYKLFGMRDRLLRELHDSLAREKEALEELDVGSTTASGRDCLSWQSEAAVMSDRLWHYEHLAGLLFSSHSLPQDEPLDKAQVLPRYLATLGLLQQMTSACLAASRPD